MSDYNLKDRMGSWGPFEEKEAQWAIFSVGNPNEGHGFALPRNIDDLHAKKIAHDLEFTTGQRYIAHIPFTTDRCGPVAKDWAPEWLPWEEFYRNSIEFMKFHIEQIRNRGEEVSRVMITIGHGGNADLTKSKFQKEIQKELDLKKCISEKALVSGKNALRVLNELEPLAEQMIEKEGNRFGRTDPEELALLYSRILMSSGHASHTEHSLAASYGVCDMKKVEYMNELLEKNFEKALKKWPPLGGLGGYLLAGGKYTEALGTPE